MIIMCSMTPLIAKEIMDKTICIDDIDKLTDSERVGLDKILKAMEDGKPSYHKVKDADLNL